MIDRSRERDHEETTLEQVLVKVCKITRFPELEAYLELKDLSSPDGFAVAEQEDFHNMVPAFGRVTVRKLMTLSNYTKVYDRFPSMDSTINHLRSLIEKTNNK